MRKGRLVGALTFVVPAILAGLSSDARACGSAVYYSREFGPQPNAPSRAVPNRSLLIAQAEQDLSEGKHAQAAVKVLSAFPALKIVKPGSLPLSDRALRILALASVRAEGTAEHAYATLSWSVGVLRVLNHQHDNNPSYQTDLGEALAKHPRGREEALMILNHLADKDLLTSAEGYAALARMKAEGGDRAGRDALVKRCEAMTKTPVAVCAVPATADAAPGT
jgi:hypothetical protein